MAWVILVVAGPVRVYQATPIVGESTREAFADAEAWLVARKTDVPHEGAASRTHR